MPKLHLPYPTQAALPLCGRQLNNHSDTRAQLHDRAEIGTVADWTVEFHKPKSKACRFCARAAGFLPPLPSPAERAAARAAMADDSEGEDE